MRNKKFIHIILCSLLVLAAGCSVNREKKPGAQPGNENETKTTEAETPGSDEKQMEYETSSIAESETASTMSASEKLYYITEKPEIDANKEYYVTLFPGRESWDIESHYTGFEEYYDGFKDEYGITLKEIHKIGLDYENEEMVNKYNALNRKVINGIMNEELNWLESIGAKDISHQGRASYEFKLKGIDIEKLSGCKGIYQILIKEIDDNKKVDVNKYLGTYAPCGEVFRSILSSLAGETYVSYLGTSGIKLDSDYLTVIKTDGEEKEYSYSVFNPLSATKSFGIETVDYVMMSGELKKGLAAADAGLNVSSFYRVLLSGDRLYINTGLTTGIFEFVRVE